MTEIFHTGTNNINEFKLITNVLIMLERMMVIHFFNKFYVKQFSTKRFHVSYDIVFIYL